MNVKKYISRAHDFLRNNVLLFTVILGIDFVSRIMNALASNNINPYGIFSIAYLVSTYFLLKFYFFLPVLIHKNSPGENITMAQIKESMRAQTKRSLKAVLFVLFIGLVILGIFYLFIAILLRINTFDLFIAQTEIGFYPIQTVLSSAMIILFAPFYIFPIQYFLEKKSLWKSLINSLKITIKHKEIIIPLAAIYSVYYFFTYLFIPDGYYYVLPVRAAIETYLTLLIAIAIYFFYTDHHKISPPSKK